MDNEELTSIDILTYLGSELQMSYQKAFDDPMQIAKIFMEFFQRWETDNSLTVLKTMQIEFEKDLDWFNVCQPLTLKHLKGKIVLLDFFTYCCINCMHILPELRKLEERFPTNQGFVVIGVHSPKFENERSAENILLAIQRYNIMHPIVNDPHSSLWDNIGVRCWPSLLLLSPDGLPMILLMGEGHGSFLEQFIGSALTHFQRQQKISKTELPVRLSLVTKPASKLRFPAKIARSPLGRFAIADAGNNRILVIDKNGVVQHKIGGIEAGFIDGDLTAARFNCPQGVAFYDEDTLIVADTENHALRLISLDKLLVESLAGTGHQGNDKIGGHIGTQQALSSPWDVAVFRTRDMDMSFHLDEQTVPEKTIILISMAGTHQIWGYFPEGIIWWKFKKFEPQCCVALVGNGLEENRNNSYPQNAAFAQPSGLAMAKDFLFIADSESSSIRKTCMVDGKVLPVVGGDRNPLNLFAFGDFDGKQYNAKLQHPLAVAYNEANDKVYVADTYNHKIKVIEPANNTVSTLTIKNESGNVITFKEPAGLCVDESGLNLLVANTNNHEIYLVNLNLLIAKQFDLDFSKIAYTSDTDSPHNGFRFIKTLPLFKTKITQVNVYITLEPGLKFTEDAPQKWFLQVINPNLHIKTTTGSLTNGQFSLQLQRLKNEVSRENLHQTEDLKLDIAVNLCNNKCCLMKRFSLLLNDDGSNVTLNEAEHSENYINIHIDHAQINLR